MISNSTFCKLFSSIEKLEIHFIKVKENCTIIKKIAQTNLKNIYH